MLSKSKIKLIHSLERKKNRLSTGLFVAEGAKLVSELLPVFRCTMLVATQQWFDENPRTQADEKIVVSPDELRAASLMQAPQQVLAVLEQHTAVCPIAALSEQLTLVLDGVQDPGNMGTIVRIADWYGIKNVICSGDCADIYNPKTTQATMGAMARVQVHYQNLNEFFDQIDNTLPIYGTLLDGDNMYQAPLSQYGVIVMGSEGNGISPEIRKRISHSLFIPNYPTDAPTSESLNVGVATAIVCAEFRRRIL